MCLKLEYGRNIIIDMYIFRNAFKLHICLYIYVSYKVIRSCAIKIRTEKYIIQLKHSSQNTITSVRTELKESCSPHVFTIVVYV